MAEDEPKRKHFLVHLYLFNQHGKGLFGNLIISMIIFVVLAQNPKNDVP